MKYSNFLKSATILFIFVAFFQQPGFAQQKDKSKMKNEKQQPLDTLLIQNTTEIKGKSNKGEYKITIPQNDLNVEVDGFKIIPPMGLGTWVAFTPSHDGAMIMGDIILTETDLKPVQQEVIKQGLTISAIHNHFVRNHPNVMYMHIGGMGKTEDMAAKAKAVLDKVAESRGHNPGTGSVPDVPYTIDTKKLDDIIG